MIDPIFSKRLQNWSRCIRARRKSLPSSTAQVLNELRLKYGPPAIEEYRNEPPISSADMADAEKLSAAYGGPWLTPQEKRVLQMVYGEGKHVGLCARELRVTYRGFLRAFDGVCQKFQRIIKTYFDNDG